MSIAILLLAAGASSRMRGGDKLLETVENAPLVATMAKRAISLGPTYVTLPDLQHRRAKALAGLNVTPIPVPNAIEGMGASICAGVNALPTNTQAVMIVLADMPDLGTQDMSMTIQSWKKNPDQIHRGTTQAGIFGHPVVFPARCFDALGRLKGDSGAGAVLKNERVIPVILPDEHATTDLDTPEDWKNWRSKFN